MNYISENVNLFVAQWRHMAAYTWVNSVSRNGLLPKTPSLKLEPMLTSHYWASVVFNWVQFYGEWTRYTAHKVQQHMSAKHVKFIPEVTFLMVEELCYKKNTIDKVLGLSDLRP